MFIKFSFFGVLTLLSTSSALALTCVNDYGGTSSCASNTTAAGDCETLGYSTSDVDNCEHYLYCPFDTSYKACSSISCADHWLFNCPTNAKSCTKCSAGGHTLYKVTECEDGYTAEYSSYKYTTSGDVYLPAFVDYISDCVADCSDYTLTECIDNASCDECTNDGVTTYKFLSCNDNYTQSQDDDGNIVCNSDGAISDFEQLEIICLTGQYQCTDGGKTRCFDEHPCSETPDGLIADCSRWTCLVVTNLSL